MYFVFCILYFVFCIWFLIFCILVFGICYRYSVDSHAAPCWCHDLIQGASIKRVISEIWLGCLSRPIVPFITCLHALKEYQGMSGYYRKLFFVPIVHSIAPTSPNIEAIIIESYFANHPFFWGTLYVSSKNVQLGKWLTLGRTKSPKVRIMYITIITKYERVLLTYTG